MPVELNVRHRSASGSREARRLRRTGKVPGVVYGKGAAEIPIELDEYEYMTKFGYSIASGLFDLVYDDGKKAAVIVKDVQWDPISEKPLHVDFLRVSADQIVNVMVHVHTENTPLGVIEGGVLEHILHEIVISVKAKDIPQAINVDVGPLDIGNSIHISDIIFPYGITCDMQDELVVATVVAPTVLVVETPEEEEEELLEGEEAEGDEESTEEAEAGEKPSGSEKK
jgi:large subunit ribosomal protein L25